MPSALKLSPSLRRFLPRLIGPIGLALLLTRVPLTAVEEVLGKTDLILALGALVLVVPILILRALRWALLVRDQGLVLSSTEALRVYGYSVFLGTFTPGRLGEFAKAAHLTNRGMAAGPALWSVLVDRILDVFFLLLFGIFSLVLVGRAAPPLQHLAVGGIVVLAGLAAALLVVLRFRERASKILSLFVPRRWRASAVAHATGFARLVRDMRASTLAAASVYTSASWLINWLAVYLLARSLDMTLSFSYVAAVSAITALLAILPISILGLGTRDGALILLLGYQGVGAAAAISLSLLMLLLLIGYGFISYLGSIVLGRGSIAFRQTL